MGSPVSPSLSDATTCLMYSTYLFTVRADRDFDFFILSTSGLTVMLLTLPNGMSPIAGSIHLWRAALILAASLTGFPVPCNSPLQVDPRLFSERRFTQNHTVKMLFRVGTGTLDNYFRLAFPCACGQLVRT